MNGIQILGIVLRTYKKSVFVKNNGKLAIPLKHPKILCFFRSFVVVKEKKMRKILLILAVILIVFAAFADEADRNACQYARKDSKLETWKFYLENFPNGECSAEAKAALHEANAALQRDLDSKDQAACNKARQQNSFEGWDQYLKNFPNGKCNFEAKLNVKKKVGGTKIGDLIWSDRSSSAMNWQSAVNYCQNLNEGSHSDWRLPTISELKTTIKNCQSGGSSCNVSDSCLSAFSDCSSKSCHCEERGNNGGYYSRLGDDSHVHLWSSSSISSDSNYAWLVDYFDGSVTPHIKSLNHNVRCVR